MTPLDETAASYDAFFRTEYPRLVRLLAGLSGQWQMAEDFAQEALLQAHRRWGVLQDFERPDLWLRRVAVNRAISARRRVRTETAGRARLGPLVPMSPESARDEELWAEVRRLPRRQAAAIILWAVEGRTLVEIGAVLGCSAETARTHVRRARKRLSVTLGEEYNDDD